MLPATCCRQHVARPRNMLPDNMLPWCKRGLRSRVIESALHTFVQWIWRRRVRISDVFLEALVFVKRVAKLRTLVLF